MNSKKTYERYIAFLRGINVGGHHKLPMADLRKEFEQLGFENTVTILNSGNVIFDSVTNNHAALEKMISEKLEKTFSFPVPTIVRKLKSMNQLFNDDPFKNVVVTKDIRLYISLLKNDIQSDVELPWTSSDNSYKIITKRDKSVLSVLDLSISNTPSAMESIEKFFKTDITTRNWKTIERIVNKS